MKNRKVPPKEGNGLRKIKVYGFKNIYFLKTQVLVIKNRKVPPLEGFREVRQVEIKQV